MLGTSVVAGALKYCVFGMESGVWDRIIGCGMGCRMGWDMGVEMGWCVCKNGIGSAFSRGLYQCLVCPENRIRLMEDSILGTTSGITFGSTEKDGRRPFVLQTGATIEILQALFFGNKRATFCE